MRVIGEMAKANLRVSLFYWNDKYVLKLEKGPFEQIYKASVFDLPTIPPGAEMEFFNNLLDEGFLKNVNHRFTEMEKEFQELIDS